MKNSPFIPDGANVRLLDPYPPIPPHTTVDSLEKLKDNTENKHCCECCKHTVPSITHFLEIKSVNGVVTSGYVGMSDTTYNKIIKATQKE